MGKTCEPKAFSFQCMTKFTTNKKKIKNKKNKVLYIYIYICMCLLCHDLRCFTMCCGCKCFKTIILYYIPGISGIRFFRDKCLHVKRKFL